MRAPRLAVQPSAPGQHTITRRMAVRPAPAGLRRTACVPVQKAGPGQRRVALGAALLPSSSSNSGGGDLVRAGQLASDSSADFTWPEPLSLSERLARSARFWSEIGPVVAAYQLQAFSFSAFGAAYTEEQKEKIWTDLHEWGSGKLSGVINELRGFYVKSGQLIGSRPDLFPEPYTRKLASLQDDLPPMEPALVLKVVERELLDGGRLGDVFSEFDAEPQGSASVAQVHRAVLREGGQEVAVKVQRPGVEALMLGDVANVKALAFQLRGRFPVDYYTVFSELEAQLRFEFDFVAEAAAMDRIGAVLATVPGGPPCVTPRSVRQLVRPRVMVMSFIRGRPLSKLAAEFEARNIQPGSLEAKIVGRKLLRSLTDAYGAMLLGEGFFHGDPHPGNIMLTDTGEVALIDFGQVKQLTEDLRLKLAKVMLMLANCGDEGCTYTDLAGAAKSLGVTFKPGVKDVDTAAAATAMWLFDSTATELPGGYDPSELSAGSPVGEVASFPQDLVFVGRATVLIRGLSTRLGIPWSLAKEWEEAAKRALAPEEEQAMAPPLRARGGLLGRVRGFFEGLALRSAMPVLAAMVALRAAVQRAVQRAVEAVVNAFKPAIQHMRNTSPSDGCAFTP